jgi:hypothetical protein
MQKGNVVTGKRTGKDGLVIALTKDGKRAKLHLYGEDAEIWRSVEDFTIKVAGGEKCWKCDGSGLYYFGGAVVNGVYTGRTGPCFACQGDGVATDADRIRCHFYFRDHFRVYMNG